MPTQPEIEPKSSKYRLLGLVGQGQFGRVFCAAHRQTGQLVALKNLEHQRFPTHKFLRELRILLSLQHPNIVTCQALEHTATGRYLVMDYCEGGTLRSLMSEEHHLSLPQSLKLVADILTGLDHAHSRGIVHCDIKPENILLNVHPSGWTARISDFGIARLSQEIADPELGDTGSPAYMAPERFYGQYSVTSDLYSVGILLFELLAGHRPFTGTPAELMSAHLNQPVHLPDAIPQVWQPVIRTALQKLSARRFRSAQAMLSAMQAVGAIAEEGFPPTTPLPLLKPLVGLPALPFRAQAQELLQQPLTALASQPPSGQRPLYHYWATGDRATVQASPAAVSSASNGSLLPNVQILPPFADAIQALLPRPQGCFVVTARSLHLIPPGLEGNPQALPLLIAELQPNSVVAIEAQGRWLATLTAAEATSRRLAFWPLAPRAALTLAVAPIAVSRSEVLTRRPQLLALDSRHVAIVELPARSGFSEQQPAGTRVQVYTRRGNWAGTLALPVRIGQALLTATAYRLLATDLDQPYSLLVIDLKPYRIVRLSVGLKPALLTATAWGYVVADARGTIVFLDQEGYRLGRTLAPAAITALSVADHWLLVATWDGQQGSLYSLDLRELGLDLVF